MRLTREGILVFAAAAVTGFWNTVQGHSPVRHVISLLAHRPLSPDVPLSELADQAHSARATILWFVAGQFLP